MEVPLSWHPCENLHAPVLARDFRRVLGALRRIDFAGPLIVELVDVRKKLASLRRPRALLGTLPG